MTLRYEYPLRWPDGWPKTPHERRRRAPYHVNMDQALHDLEYTLSKMHVRDVVIATNVQLGKKGRPTIVDPNAIPGAAVYWTALDQPRAIACDKWEDARGNVRAIGLSLEALRMLERTGAGQILERAYQGFAALPSGDAPKRPWREVLGLDWLAGPAFAVRAAVDASYKSLVAKHHPDAGGSAEKMIELNAARDAAYKELAAQ